MPATRRRTAIVLLFLALLLLFTVLPARADTGPKRSISIRFEDLPAGTVYAAILPEAQYAYSYPNYMNNLTVPKEIADKFAGREFGGYVFTGLIRDVTESKRIEWTYLAPNRFRILLYAAATDISYLSDPCEQYAFRSGFTARLDGDTFRITRTTTVFMQILGFLGRLAVTILLEVLIALLFGIRKKEQLKWIVIVNAVTQLILNLIMLRMFNNVFFYYIMLFGLIELVIFVSEAAAYRHLMTGENDPGKGKIWAYSFAANLVSFLLGFVITKAFPNILQL